MAKEHADETEKMEQMRRWVCAVSTELQIDPGLLAAHEKELLALISTVAHGPSRPGAPMTAFLVGYAGASSGRDADDVITQVRELASSWS